MIISRNEFVEAILYNMNDDDLLMYFELSREAIEAGAWNIALEYCYGEATAS